VTLLFILHAYTVVVLLVASGWPFWRRVATAEAGIPRIPRSNSGDN